MNCWSATAPPALPREIGAEQGEFWCHGSAHGLAEMVRQRSEPKQIARAGRTSPWPRYAATPSIRRSAATRPCSWRSDRNGNIASGTSTSGWGWKYPGRLGDSPIIGAGSYADTPLWRRACTGAGEMAIRCCTARSVVLYMKDGMNVERAVREAVDDMRALKGGLISRVTIHAIDAQRQSQGRRGERRRQPALLALEERHGGAGVPARRTGCHQRKRNETCAVSPLHDALIGDIRPGGEPPIRTAGHQAISFAANGRAQQTSGG